MTISSPTRAFSAPQPAVTAVRMRRPGHLPSANISYPIPTSHRGLSPPSPSRRDGTTPFAPRVLGGDDNSSVKDGDERFQLMTMDDALSQYAGHSFKGVIFCAPPPRGFDDYPYAVRDDKDPIMVRPDIRGIVRIHVQRGDVRRSGRGDRR